MKNYFQRRLDSGQSSFTDIVLNAETKKERGEPTGPLPIPNMAARRRYEIGPSPVLPRPLAPHAEVSIHPESRVEGRTKGIVLPPPNTAKAASADKDRKYPPLAQATGATIGARPVNEDVSHVTRTTGPAGLPQRLGPRIGYFAEEKRDRGALYAPTSQLPPQQPAGVSDMVHSSTLLPAVQTGMPPVGSEPTYLQRARAVSAAASHSRHPSLAKASGSPILPPLDPDKPTMRRDSFPMRQPIPPMVRPGLPQSILSSPALEPVRPPSTTAAAHAHPQLPEPPRQVPAKRSNIMNILNDEPEEPPPRKRHVSVERAAPAQVALASSSRPAYTTSSTPHQEDVYQSGSQQRSMEYSQSGQYLTQPSQSRPFADYGGYPASHSGSGIRPSSNDWMARFDPRGQQQQQSQPQSQHVLPGLSSGRSTYGQLQQEGSLTSLPPPIRTPTPPTTSLSQRSSYSVRPPSAVTPQSPKSSSMLPTARDIAQPHGSGQVYRSTISSPPRTGSSSLAYPSRRGPSPPIGLVSLMSRQPPASQTPSSSHTPHTSSAHHHHHHHRQPHHHHRTSLGVTGQFSANPPPPLAGPSSLSRSYTPPSILHPNPGAPPPPQSGSLPYGANALPPVTASMHGLSPPRFGGSPPEPGSSSRGFIQGSSTTSQLPGFNHPPK